VAIVTRLRDGGLENFGSTPGTVTSLLQSIQPGSEIVQHSIQWELTAFLTAVQWPEL
jgi:hypothetical protein